MRISLEPAGGIGWNQAHVIRALSWLARTADRANQAWPQSSPRRSYRDLRSTHIRLSLKNQQRALIRYGMQIANLEDAKTRTPAALTTTRTLVRKPSD